MEKKITFDTAIGKHARNQYRLWHFSKEWRAGIIAVSLLKIITWIISVYAGYYFVYNESFPFWGNPVTTTVFTLIILVLIEVAVWASLSKFFKFLFHGQIIAPIITGAIAFGIYFLSFHMSTNGLAMRQADKVDETELITDNSKLEVQAIKTKFEQRIQDYRQEINTIKANPAGWKNGKLSGRLAEFQLKDIARFNNIIDSLDKQCKSDIYIIKQEKNLKLASNKTKTTEESNKYYNYVIAIMIAQFLFNGLLMFAWRCIANENDKTSKVNEDIANAEESIIGGFFSHIVKRLHEEAGKIQLSIDNKDSNIIDITKNENKQIGYTNSSNTVTEIPKPSTQIGFKRQDEQKQKENSSNNTPNSSNTRSNTKEKIIYKNFTKSEILGKLRENDMLRYCLKKKSNGEINLTQNQISKQCNVKRWKYYEFQNLMISAGLIQEPNKFNS